jgi:hypothetical protein
MSEENTTTGNKPMQEKLRIMLGAVLLVVISYQLGLGHARSESERVFRGESSIRPN